MEPSTPNPSHKILIGVSASIAAYRVADVVSLLTKHGHEAQCMLTSSARVFVSPLVLETLSGRPALSDLFGPSVSGTEHIRLARWADALLITPATADIIARLALGLADDLVTTVALATEAPLIIAPAMNAIMWSKPIVQEHVQQLRTHGAWIIEPAEGLLACGETGFGRLASTEEIVGGVEAILTPADLAGLRLLITSGPTTSSIDAVRYLTNHSTGKMGAALAEQAALRGAEVTCVCGIDKGSVLPSVSKSAKGRLTVIPVHTADEMRGAALATLPNVDGVIASAAVLDYGVTDSTQDKTRRNSEDISLRLRPSVDVLAALVAAARGQWFAGFAAETGDLIESGRLKLLDKRLDFLFTNRIARAGECIETGFGGERNAGTLLTADGAEIEFPLMSKRELASKLLTAFASHKL